MKTLKIVVILLLITSCKSSPKQISSNSDTAINVPITKKISDEAKLKLKTEQKQMLSVLTGESKINDKTTLKGRWDEASKVEVRTYLSNLIKKTGLTPLEHNYNIDLPLNGGIKNYKGTNIYSIIPAKNVNNEYIVLGAHYDSVTECPGANDNATGCALIYSVASLLTKVDSITKNVILVFFDQEELGLVGSQAFVSLIKEKKYKVHSVHTVDQMGWDNDNDKNIEIELPTRQLKKLYQKHAKSFGISAFVTNETGSDHQAFRKAGFDAVGITEEYNNNDTTPHYHRPTDTYDTVNFDYLASSTLFVYNVIEELVGQ